MAIVPHKRKHAGYNPISKKPIKKKPTKKKGSVKHD